MREDEELAEGHVDINGGGGAAARPDRGEIEDSDGAAHAGGGRRRQGRVASSGGRIRWPRFARTTPAQRAAAWRERTD